MLWPVVAPVAPPVLAPWFLPPFDRAAVSLLANASVGWGTANLALYYPILLSEPCIVTTAWWQNGTVVNGNVDVGIYDEAGRRIVSTGSVAQAGVSAGQSLALAHTPVPAGLLYLGIALSSATGTLWTTGGSISGGGAMLSLYRQLTAFPLPNPATFATTVAVSVALVKFGFLKWPRTVL